MIGRQLRSALVQTPVLVGKRWARTRPESRRLAPPPIQKRLDCVIMGTPNVGKSVLLNELVKHKIAATSRKRHTTRGEIMGVFNHRNTQLVFYDTPGFISKHEKRKEAANVIREEADTSLEKADVVILMVDAARMLTHNYRYVFGEMVELALKHMKKELILVLNKVDLVHPKTKLLETTHELVSLINGVKLGPDSQHLAQLDTTTFMISALEKDGVLDLKNYLVRIADQKPWLVETGHTNLSPEEVVQEIVLEALLDHVHDEIPYIAEVVCKSIQPLGPYKVRIDVNIHLDSGRQAKIVVGDKAHTLLTIRQDASKMLETIYKGKTVILYLWVLHSKQRDASEIPHLSV